MGVHMRSLIDREIEFMEKLQEVIKKRELQLKIELIEILDNIKDKKI